LLTFHRSIVVVLNKKKKMLTLDQTDLAGMVSSYTPYMTRECSSPITIRCLPGTCRLIFSAPGWVVLVQFHDYLYTLPMEGDMPIPPIASSSTSKPSSSTSPSSITPAAAAATSSAATTKKKNKLEVFPEAYRPLIVMLGQESGLSGSKELARYIKGKIKPAVMGEEEGVVGESEMDPLLR